MRYRLQIWVVYFILFYFKKKEIWVGYGFGMKDMLIIGFWAWRVEIVK